VLRCGRSLPSVAQPVPAQPQKKCFHRRGQASPGTGVLMQRSHPRGAPGVAHAPAWERQGNWWRLVLARGTSCSAPSPQCCFPSRLQRPLRLAQGSSDLRTLSLPWDSDVVQDSRLQLWLPWSCCARDAPAVSRQRCSSERPAWSGATTDVLATKLEEAGRALCAERRAQGPPWAGSRAGSCAGTELRKL